jgi:hypothetical protein
MERVRDSQRDCNQRSARGGDRSGKGYAKGMTILEGRHTLIIE